ncbi:response regulator [Maridesulfovibrio frigidus]|uniref:response regulator n=1 Tax=Maridesulfovibrio frigidus TaxID=340956 RepID=UPI0004E10658|nr:response regulator [Maridesulfovibrio frigidus]
MARADNDLKKQNSFYSSVLDCSDVGLYRANIDGECVFANDICNKIAGCVSKLQKSDSGSLKGPFCVDPESRRVFMDRLFSEGEVHGFESLVPNVSGEPLHIAEDAKLLLDEYGQPAGIVGAVRDVSSFKNIEKELSLQKEYLTAVMDNSPESVFIEDFDGNFLKVNKVFAKYAGVSDPTLCVGNNVRTYLPPHLASTILEDISNVAATGVDSHFMLPAKDSYGNTINLAVQHSLLKNDMGKPVAIIGYARNMDSLADNSAVSFSSSEVPFSMSSLCHELRTPFVGIIGSFKALTREELPQIAKGYAAKGLQSAERYMSALNTLLHAFSGEDDTENDNGFFNPARAFSKNLDIYTPTIELDGRSIYFITCENLPENMQGNGRGVSRAIFGLLSNAMSLLKGKVLRAGITVKNISGREADFCFWVEDPFGDRDSLDVGSLSEYFRDTVEKIGGKINFGSEVGASFGFELKALIIDEKRIDECITENSIKSILLAEDDMSSQFMLRKKLEKWGYVVRTASTGFEVLNCLKEDDCDLVLMDIQMPEMDGYDAVKSIRKNEAGDKRIPILMMSAYAGDGDFDKLSSLGIDEYISKPIDMVVLKDMIAKYFD